jgi:integrase/recombinase XerD
MELIKSKTVEISRKGKKIPISLKMDELIGEFIEDFTSIHTRRAYKGDLIDYFLFLARFYKGLVLNKVEKKHIISYKRNLEIQGLDSSSGRGLSESSINRKLATISKFYQFLIIDKKCLKENPCIGVKRFKSPDAVKTLGLRREDVQEILEATCEKNLIELLHKAILYTLFTTGSRRGALMKLKIKDFVKIERGFALVFKEKGGKLRSKGLHPQCSEVIERYLDRCQVEGFPMDDQCPLFRPARNGGSPKGKEKKKYLGHAHPLNRPISEMVIRNIIKKFLMIVGLPDKYSSHSARVSYITELLEKKIPLNRVSMDVGHSNLKQTSMYDEALKRSDIKISKELGYL